MKLNSQLNFLLCFPIDEFSSITWETIIFAFIGHFRDNKFIVGDTYYLYLISSEGEIIWIMPFDYVGLDFDDVTSIFFPQFGSDLEKYINALFLVYQSDCPSHLFLGVSKEKILDINFKVNITNSSILVREYIDSFLGSIYSLVKRYFKKILWISLFISLLLICISLYDIVLYGYIFDNTLQEVEHVLSYSDCTDKDHKCIFAPFIDLFDKSNSSVKYFPSYFTSVQFNLPVNSYNLPVDDSNIVKTISYKQYFILEYYFNKWTSLLNDLNDIVLEYSNNKI